MKTAEGQKLGCRHSSPRLTIAALLTLAFIGLQSAASAAVVYDSTPRVYSFPLPNTSTPNPSVNFTLDLNGDSVAELGVSLANHFGQIQIPEEVTHLLASLTRPNEGESDASYLVSTLSPSPSSPAAMQLGSLIGPDATFSESFGATLLRGEYRTFQGTAVPKAPGNFLTANSPAYVGAQFLIVGELRYGWVRLSFIGGSQGGLNQGLAVVSGMAYEDSGQPILAGQVADWLTADFDRDGIVDRDDLASWTGGVGDGDSDGNDFLVWQQQFGASSFVAAAQSAASAIPEPTGGLLAIFGAACGVFARQRVTCRANRLR